MSVFRVKNSPYYQFDFQIKRFRFYGSTAKRNEREAKDVEKAKRAEASRLIEENVTSGRKPLTVGAAFDRWWTEVGQHGSDPDLKRALDWLQEQVGRSTALHDINDDMISKAIEARRTHVMRAGRPGEDRGAETQEQALAPQIRAGPSALPADLKSHRCRQALGG